MLRNSIFFICEERYIVYFRIIWLEQGDFSHILVRHSEEFEAMFKISNDPRTIGNLIFKAVTSYPVIDTEEGRYPGAIIYIYEIWRPGGSGGLHVLVDKDGHIVTAYTKK